MANLTKPTKNRVKILLRISPRCKIIIFICQFLQRKTFTCILMKHQFFINKDKKKHLTDQLDGSKLETLAIRSDNLDVNPG